MRLWVLCRCRKRSRDEDSSDFMPISKRINSLSITNQYVDPHLSTSQLPQLDSTNSSENCHWNHQQQQLSQAQASSSASSNNHNIHHHPHGAHYPSSYSNGNSSFIQNGHDILNGHNAASSSQTTLMGEPSHTQPYMTDENYNPELSVDQNPFYYNKNKLLFDLHLERERRQQGTTD